MSKRQQTISVIISVFNEETTIEGCLLSLQEQTRQPDEVIIIDNNSTDRTVEIATRFNFVKCIKESQQGIWPARKTGLDAAKSDILVNTDADARFPIDWLQNIEKAFNTGVTALTGPGHFYDGSRIMQAIQRFIYMEAYFIFAGSLYAQRPLFGSNYAVSKELWNIVTSEVHAKDDSYPDDMDLTYHIIQYTKVRFLRNNHVNISMRPGRNTFIHLSNRSLQAFRCVGGHLKNQSPPWIWIKGWLKEAISLLRVN